MLSKKLTSVDNAIYCKATNGNVYGDTENWYASGGAGCPSGKSYIKKGTLSGSSEQYVGGLLIIYANSFYNNTTGVITVEGGKSDKNTKKTSYSSAGGGASGGGSINVFFCDNYKLDGTINVSGGISYGTYENSYGGAGGEGSYNIGNIKTGEYVNVSQN